jgi:hypothetical protein
LAFGFGISIRHFNSAKRIQFDDPAIQFDDLAIRFGNMIWQNEVNLKIRQCGLANRFAKCLPNGLK